MSGLRALAAALALAAAAAGSNAAEANRLENDAMSLEFGGEGESFGLKALVNKKTGGTSFVHATKAYPSLWGMRFVDTVCGSNRSVHVSNARGAKALTVRRAEESLTFVWKEVSLPDSEGTLDVAARVTLPKGDAMAEWTIQVKNRSERWALESIQYPFMTRVVEPEDPKATVLTPSKANVGGRLLKLSEYKANTTLFSFQYPSDRLPMCALMTGDSGVYFAAHDRECREKILTVSPDGTVWFETLVENAGVAGRAEGSPKYAVTTGVFRGDWWTAAHIYRDWALRQRWAKKGKIAFRDDYPKQAAETEIWVIGGGNTNYAKASFAAMEKVWPDVGKGFTWSEWTVVGGGRATNRSNPEFFPAIPGTAELSAEKGKAGFLTSLYVNGRIWDKSTTGFEYAQVDATRRRDGTLHNEDYHSWDTVFHFAVMCPWCKTWQQAVRDLAVRCLDELNMKAVYFDQVSCGSSTGCYDPNHGHPLGGGRWWEQGYRKMFTEIKREFVKRGAAVISEQMGEMYLDLIDVYLNATGYGKFDVPLFPAIYSGYMTHYGRPVPHSLSEADEWREYARTLVWGEAYGWIIPAWPMRGGEGGQFHRQVKTIYELAKVRKANRDILAYGTMEDELRPLDADADVFGTVWKNAAGDRWAAAIANAAKTEKTVRYRLPGSKAVRTVRVPARTVIVDR